MFTVVVVVIVVVVGVEIPRRRLTAAPLPFPSSQKKNDNVSSFEDRLPSSSITETGRWSPTYRFSPSTVDRYGGSNPPRRNSRPVSSSARRGSRSRVFGRSPPSSSDCDDDEEPPIRERIRQKEADLRGREQQWDLAGLQAIADSGALERELAGPEEREQAEPPKKQLDFFMAANGRPKARGRGSISQRSLRSQENPLQLKKLYLRQPIEWYRRPAQEAIAKQAYHLRRLQRW